MQTAVGKRLCLVLLIATTVMVEAPWGQPLQPSPTKVRAVVLPFLSFAPLFIAQAEGYFAEQGLEVTFENLTGSVEALPALAQGGVDVLGAAANAGIFNAIAGGADIRVVADKGFLDAAGCTNSGLMIRTDLADSITSPAELQGRRVSLEATNPEGYYVDRLLSTASLSLADLDIQVVPNPALSEALKNGSLDLTHASEPWITRIARSGAGVVWAPAQNVIPDFQFAVLLYGPNLLDRDPDAGHRFMVAYLQAVRQFLQGKTDRNLDIMEQATGLARDLLQEACWISFAPDGRINAASLIDFQQWLHQQGLLDEPVPVERFWNPSFVEAANQALENP